MKKIFLLMLFAIMSVYFASCKYNNNATNKAPKYIDSSKDEYGDFDGIVSGSKKTGALNPTDDSIDGTGTNNSVDGNSSSKPEALSPTYTSTSIDDMTPALTNSVDGNPSLGSSSTIKPAIRPFFVNSEIEYVGETKIEKHVYEVTLKDSNGQEFKINAEPSNLMVIGELFLSQGQSSCGTILGYV